MPDPIDEGRAALDGAEPTTDLWAEATRRAAAGEVVPLLPPTPRRRGVWWAAAAVIALVAGTLGVLSMDEDESVDVGPAGQSDVTTYQGEDGCSFGITGEPPEPRQFGPAEDPAAGTHFVLGDLTAQVNVPSWVIGAANYPWEPVELRRGAAELRAVDEQSTLVRYAAGGGACDTFSVVVSGGSADVTEPAAIALADRIVVQSELARDDGTTTTSILPSGGCFFSVSGDPVDFAEGPADPPLFDPSGQPEGQTIAHATLGAQVAELHVPGLVLTDLVGERVEDIELRRGTAQLWFGPDFVQVRWFPGTEEPCDSFTLTVAGGTEDGNRHAAVDLADRILLPTEIGVEEPPTGGDDVATELEGDWQLESSTSAGEPTDGTGLTFVFLDGEANWTDGCNSFSAPYTGTGDTTFRLGDTTSTGLPCPANPTSQAVQTVMGAEQIEVDLDSEFLRLTAGDTVLALRPA